MRSFVLLGQSIMSALGMELCMDSDSMARLLEKRRKGVCTYRNRRRDEGLLVGAYTCRSATVDCGLQLLEGRL